MIDHRRRPYLLTSLVNLLNLCTGILALDAFESEFSHTVDATSASLLFVFGLRLSFLLLVQLSVSQTFSLFARIAAAAGAVLVASPIWVQVWLADGLTASWYQFLFDIIIVALLVVIRMLRVNDLQSHSETPKLPADPGKLVAAISYHAHQEASGLYVYLPEPIGPARESRDLNVWIEILESQGVVSGPWRISVDRASEILADSLPHLFRQPKISFSVYRIRPKALSELLDKLGY